MKPACVEHVEEAEPIKGTTRSATGGGASPPCWIAERHRAAAGSCVTRLLPAPVAPMKTTCIPEHQAAIAEALKRSSRAVRAQVDIIIWHPMTSLGPHPTSFQLISTGWTRVSARGERA
eukprot:CAMPEP_0119413484 /NCGR_PEP_ID=MMETSP1335-20130426/5556_1 /TAXON_ID=259385 /ORGANISM="Chrysoculter rhomboideus, Strain RCC1486" /LENGTH=118 /DNA_ID=CAMNT_0007438281 /DNA_START=95 /DNA_END=452 /DNA_ORIENTATION=+